MADFLRCVEKLPRVCFWCKKSTVEKHQLIDDRVTCAECIAELNGEIITTDRDRMRVTA